MAYDLTPIPIFSDNYVWTLSNPDTERAVVVDPGDAEPVTRFLEENGLELEAILITHQHWDHVSGIKSLKKRYGTTVYGPAREAIDNVDITVSEGQTIDAPGLGMSFRVLDLQGHTAGHIGYLSDGLLFCGDTLFSAGCGRLFDGTAEQLHTSLEKIAGLPDATLVCCTHEYTLNNLHFALEVEPGNADIAAYIPEVENMMQQRRPSLPTSLEKERRINPFLRTTFDTVRSAVSARSGRPIENDLDCFKALRKWKDEF
jgi:hydroxyacylglutathione hydrolase